MSDTRAIAVEAVYRGGYSAEVSARGHRITVDEPVADGGADSGPMPTELLCASIASCFCLALGHVAAKHDVTLPEDVRVGVRAERDGRALRYGRFAVTVSSSLPRAAMQPLVARAERYCWVSNTLALAPALDFSIEETAKDTTEVP
ncbi:OsmC family protein [Conexibacter sp. CPCC 206217]|uniref:OsmC family protein n=1 Tax=Conexibacter sp. CPCC 206217 TaxID=3064574 RepID=UPI00271F317F|nr:OsmC family protein [Conexibacter sp. CPCC 206217]MDO8212341.1 OsmC family protein [Conexibacter sp. CPCC 206217]